MRDFYEKFARFFESPTREGLRELLEYNYGEQNNLDFKQELPSFSKLAKHFLAFANSGGGCIILGVAQKEEEGLVSVGIAEVKDKAEIDNGIRSFIPVELKYEILDFCFNSAEYDQIIGKKFQVIFIDDKPEYLPYISKKDGESIRQNTIYIRKGTRSQEANYEELQKIINRRVDTNYSSTSELKLEEHLAQLKILYTQIEKFHYRRKNASLTENGLSKMLSSFALAISSTIGEREAIPNPDYPTEDFEEFISRLITQKKKKVEYVLELK